MTDGPLTPRIAAEEVAALLGASRVGRMIRRYGFATVQLSDLLAAVIEARPGRTVRGFGLVREKDRSSAAFALLCCAVHRNQLLTRVSAYIQAEQLTYGDVTIFAHLVEPAGPRGADVNRSRGGGKARSD